jgi:hypothetical protein
LRNAVADRPEFVYPEEDGGAGLEVRAATWKVPAVISADDLREAREYVQHFTKFDHPTPGFEVEDWLMLLFDGKAHGMEPPALAARAAALAEAVEDYPPHCFTVETRKLARKRFRHIPTDYELAAFCEEIDQEEREVARRMMHILDAGHRTPERRGDDDRESPRQAAQWGWSSPEERRAHEEYLREARDRERIELAAIARAKAAEAGEELPPPPAPRLAHETDREFVTRMNEPVRAYLDAEAERMRRGGKGRGGRTRNAAGSPVQVAEALKVLKGSPPVPRPDIAERARVQEEEPEPSPEVAA